MKCCDEMQRVKSHYSGVRIELAAYVLKLG